MNKYVQLCLRYMFSHVGLFFVVCTYCILGALLFQGIEWDNEFNIRSAVRDKALFIEESRERLAEQCKNLTYELAAGPQMVKDWLDQYQALIIDAINTGPYQGTYSPELNMGWSFPSGLVFTVSVVLAIGYGNVSPKTDLGRFVLIVYAVLGIPLTLMFLANIGKSFADVVRLAYARGCCFLCWKKRKHNYSLELKKQTPVIHVDDLDDDSEAGEFRKRTDTVVSNGDNGDRHMREGRLMVGMKTFVDSDPEAVLFVPISLTLGILAIYVFLGTLLFHYTEGWTYLISSYFNIVSLMTIGFGDYVPGWQAAGTTIGKVKLIFGALYVLVGLAVISMGLNLIVEEIVEMSRKAGKKMGILHENHGQDDKAKSNLEKAVRRTVARP